MKNKENNQEKIPIQKWDVPNNSEFDLHLLFHTKKLKKKFKNEKIFSMKNKEKSREDSNTKWYVPNKSEFAYTYFSIQKK